MRDPVDLLILNGFLVAMDDAGTLLENGGVAVHEDRIAAVGKSGFIRDNYIAERVIDAARALGIGDQVGSLEHGKKADIILVDLDRPHLTPQTFIPNLLAFYVNGNDVDTVLVDGRILMEGGEIRSVDAAQVFDLARREAEKVFERVDLEPFLTVDRNFWHGTRWEE